MSTAATPAAARKPRYVLDKEQHATVILTDENGAPSVHHTAQMLDLSQNGARLSVGEQLPFTKVVGLKLTFSDLGLEFCLACKVCWSRPSKNGRWVFGCALNPGLPEKILARLAANGKMDRRTNEADEFLLEAAARWDDEAKDVTVRLHDYSQGGFCLASTQPPRLGALLRLRLGSPGEIPTIIAGRSQWSVMADTQYLVGMSFAGQRQFERMSQALALLGVAS